MSVRLLDGGTAHTFRERSGAADEPLWTVREMLKDPALLRGVHEAYLGAGADIITTLTADTTQWRMIRAGLGDAFKTALGVALAAAEAARDATKPDALIAGCLPPLRGRYRPDKPPSIAEIEPEYAELALLMARQVDFFLCGPMASIGEAVAAARAASSAGKPVWISLAVHDCEKGRLKSGERLIPALDRLDGVTFDALLLHASDPDLITRALWELGPAVDTHIGVVADAFVTIGEDWDVTKGADDIIRRKPLGPSCYAERAAEWIECGATIIGGADGVSPSHMARLSQLVGSLT